MTPCTQRALGLAVGLVLCLGAGCSGRDALVVGVKDFTEQRILGEVIRRLAAEGSRAGAKVVVCNDTYDCQSALLAGDIDVMVE